MERMCTMPEELFEKICKGIQTDRASLPANIFNYMKSGLGDVHLLIGIGVISFKYTPYKDHETECVTWRY